MKRKGFTIVEILAAVVIIAILSVVVIPNISSYITISKDEYNKDVKKQMILAGKNYYSENQERLPRDTSEKTMDYISVQELSTLKYVDNEFVDADDNSCMEKSYVVAANKGLGTNYYACMICGDIPYIDADEEFYCDAVNYIDNNGNSDEDGSGDGESSDGSLTCVVDKETTGYTDDGLYVTLTATSNKEDGYITSVYVINKDTKSDEEQLSDADKNKKSVTTTVYFPEYGENDVYAMDNRYNKVKCTTVNYKEPTNTKFDVTQYYVTKAEYESHKNTGFTNQELEELPEYDGSWKNGYIYVKLDYYNFQYDSIEIDGEGIAIGKKYFFIEDEGETTTKIVATRSDEGSSDIVRNITAKLDRTAPTVTLSSTNNVATSQTATMSCTDDIGITGYYQGSNSNFDLSDFTSISNRTSYTRSRTISTSVNVYFACKDQANNISTKLGTYYRTSFSVSNGTVSPKYVITLKGKSFRLPTPKANTNYQITNRWYSDSSYTTTVSSIYRAAANKTLYAKANKKKYTISYVCVTGTTNCPSGATVEHGSSYKVSSIRPSASGYTFFHWNTKRDGTGSIYNAGATISNVTSNITLYSAVLSPVLETFTCPRSMPFATVVTFNVNTNAYHYYYAINRKKISGELQYRSSDCAIKSSSYVGNNCVNNRWVSPLSNYIINAYDYTSNSTRDKYTNRNITHSISLRYALTFSGKTIYSRTLTCSYTTV